MSINYNSFLEEKAFNSPTIGFEPDQSRYPDIAKEHQVIGVNWACKRGRAALFFDTGLGKTLSQIMWAEQVFYHTGQPVLIIAPLAVSHQTQKEAEKFGFKAEVVSESSDVINGINITNYEKLKKFDCSVFGGVVLDESSILKGMQGKMRRMITDSFINTKYKLSCTATPSPNDFMELGTQSEFLGVMTQTEMLAMFFIHDGGDTSKWRLKGHGKRRFFEWLATWSMYLRSPADIGLDGSEYNLPPVEYHSYVINTRPTDSLFVEPAQGMLERNRARKDSVEYRCKKAAELINSLDEPCVVWCNRNDESELLASLIDGAVEVTGSDKDDHKSSAMMAFAEGSIKCLVTKPKIAGFGMNWQSSRHAVFVGLSDSWESYYQAVRRQWRFGQKRTVHVHVISADTEGLVVENIKRKNAQNDEISQEMADIMADFTKKEVFGATQEKTEYNPQVILELPEWI